MPNKQAAKKDLRKNARRAVGNLRMKTHVKHLLNDALSAMKADPKSAASIELVKKFQQAADKAAKKNVLSSNAAAKKKARLMKVVATKKA